MIKDFVEKWGLKEKKNTGLYAVLLIAVLILLFGGRLLGSLSSTGPPQSSSTDSDHLTVTHHDAKHELEGILTQIQGVGNVSVMVSYQSGPEKMFANDVSLQSSSNSEKNADGSVRNTSESQSDTTLVQMSNQPVLVKEVYATVRGVVVVADGAGDPVVKRIITEAVKSVLDVPEHRISVFIKKTGR